MKLSQKEIKTAISILNNDTDTSLDALLLSDTVQNATGEVVVPFGNGSEGIIYKDISIIPNLLISGTTGCGKTTFIQSMVLSIMAQYTTDTARFLIYDSKSIDYICFNGSPHLLLPVITNKEKAAAMISWAVAEAKSRIQKNTIKDSAHVFIIIDDYAELAENATAVSYLLQLMQIGRSAKIHCIISTAIPTVSIITTELKNNILHRIAFAVPAKSTSRVILDMNGAEELQYPGELLFKDAGKIKTCFSPTFNYSVIKDAVKNTISIQSQYIPDSISIENTKRNEQVFPRPSALDAKADAEEMQLFKDCVECAIASGEVSISMLQRRFRIGYNRASRMTEMMEERGIIGPSDGSKSRKVLWTAEDLHKL